MSNYFNPYKFFELAKKLESEGNESANRTIINRCYYSCYLRIKDELYTKHKSIDNHISHDLAFYRVNRKNKKIGRYINTLYSARLVSDYSLNSHEIFDLFREKHTKKMGKFTVDVNSPTEYIKTAERFHTCLDSVDCKRSLL